MPQTCIYLAEHFSDDKEHIENEERWPVYEAHKSAIGWRTLDHYAQIIAKKEFVRYDYGTEENLKKYGSKYPPPYDLSKVYTKVAIFHGDLDRLADLRDVYWLAGDSGLSYKAVPKLYHFGHESFLMARNMTYFERDVINIIDPPM